jgi:ABC transport system ATP-binding/permease protein
VFEGEGKIRNFPGNYSEYREWLKEQEKEEQAIKQAAPAPVAEKKQEQQPASKRKPSYQEKKEFDELEQKIEKLNTRKAEVIEAMNAGTTTDHAQLTAWASELEQINSELEEKEMRWLELSEIM